MFYKVTSMNFFKRIHLKISNICEINQNIKIKVIMFWAFDCYEYCIGILCFWFETKPVKLLELSILFLQKSLRNTMFG